MLNKINPLGQDNQIVNPSMEILQNRCTQEKDAGACQSLMMGKQAFRAGAATGDTSVAAEMAQRMPRFADGGEALLAPEERMEEDPLVALAAEDPFLPLMEVLGEEAYMMLLEAMSQYPVVALVAEMALKTQDGFVEGMGGPKDDQVPALLSDGEYIFSAEAVEVIGIDKLEEMHEEAKRIAASQV
jgi:hypothetical protein